MLRYYGNKSLRLITCAMARVGGGRNPLRCLRRQVARWGQPVSTMWHLAPEAPPEFFLDSALLEEAGAHGMAGGAQI